MDCPRCGATGVTTPACPRCGVIVAKARPMAAREERIERWRAGVATATEAPPTESAPEEARGLSRWWYAVAVIAVVLSVAIARKSSRDPKTAAAPVARRAPSAANTADAPRPQAVPLEHSPPPSAADIQAEVKGLSEEDRLQAEALVRHVNRGGAMTASDVSGAEALLAAHPEEKILRDLLEAVLLSAAYNERKRRNFAVAAAYLRRAAAIDPTSARPLIALVENLAEAGDWPGAEAAARAALALDRLNMDVWRQLGYALLRLDRNREAAEVLREALQIRDDSQTRDLLAQVEKGLTDERGMTEQHLAHFNVRYDGGEHTAVGQEILRALERHYATLVSRMDHQPATAIPVVLFTREGYYNASGAPAWAGGNFDGTDGRIRIPIGGLTASLTPDMDGTLIHELTHAFIFDRSRGVAPREVHEGLAQYMEGKRSASDYGPQVLAGLADGRIGGVGGFYLAALSYVEHLIAVRGMGGMNDLLKAMGETGDRDQGFQRVHGHNYEESRRRWAQHLRQQYGS